MNNVTKKDILVSVVTLAYNHRDYIRQCIDGILMQKTDFKFELLINDDASTDGTTAIIEEYEKAYPGIIKPIYQIENQYSQGISISQKYLYPKAQGRYIALCEGDDYWTDPLKLQKQVDILESDPSLVAVATNSEIVDKDGNQIHSEIEGVVLGNMEGRYNLRDFVHHHHSYPTASVLFRNIHSEEYDKMIAATRNPYYSDWTQWFILHLFGDFYYLNEVTTAYRINPNSVTHKNTNERRLLVAKENFRINNSLKSILPPEYGDLKKELDDDAWIWYHLARAYWHSNKYFRSVYSLFRGFIKCPRQLFTELGKFLRRRK